MKNDNIKCLGCKYWQPDIPVGHCLHQEGYFHPTSNEDVFASASPEFCPLKKEGDHEKNM